MCHVPAACSQPCYRKHRACTRRRSLRARRQEAVRAQPRGSKQLTDQQDLIVRGLWQARRGSRWEGAGSEATRKLPGSPFSRGLGQLGSQQGRRGVARRYSRALALDDMLRWQGSAQPRPAPRGPRISQQRPHPPGSAQQSQKSVLCALGLATAIATCWVLGDGCEGLGLGKGLVGGAAPCRWRSLELSFGSARSGPHNTLHRPPDTKTRWCNRPQTTSARASATAARSPAAGACAVSSGVPGRFEPRHAPARPLQRP